MILVVFAVSESQVSAAFRMMQNLGTGRKTESGFSFVTCNDPDGFTHWNTRSISIHHNTSNKGSGKAAALKNAMAAWTNVSGAAYVLTYAGTTSSGFVTDGRNTMVWVQNGACTGLCRGLTALVLQSGQVIVESDIVFNNGITWTTTGSNYDTQSVATHELGHLLGIGHSTYLSGPPTMSQNYFGTGDMRSLETEDKAALQCSEDRYKPPCNNPPQPPLSLTVYSGSCYGHNDLTWAAACSGVTRYELYGSSSSNFSNQYLEYSGLSLTRHVTVTQTTYFRVRACNSSGCGNYRVADGPAQYYSGCY